MIIIENYENTPKKYILRAKAEIETTLETSTPECAKGLLESVMKDNGILADITNLSLQEVNDMTKQQHDKITWLNRALHAEKKLKALESLLKRDRERLQAVSANCKGNDKGKSDGRINSVETALMRVAETEEKYDAFRREYNSIRAEIESEIKKLHDFELEAVLMYRHLEYLSIEETAERMHYNEKTIRRKYNKGIEKLSGNVRQCP